MPAKRPAAPARRPATSRELRADVVLAVALFVAAVLSAALGAVAGLYGDDSPGLQWALLYAFALAAAIAVRRRFPCTAAIVVAVAFFAAGTAQIPEFYVGNICLFIAVYTVGAWVDDRRRATITRVLIIVGMFLWLLVTAFQEATTAPVEDELSRAGAFSPFLAFMLMQLLVNVAFFGGAWYMGDRAHAAALQRDALEQRTAELERERETTAAQAVALDRVRIARELHDVVAHHVSAMGVQAGAARAVLERDPAAARAALLGVEESSRSALAELRQLLETLRTSATETTDASTLHLSALPALVAHAGDNGLPTTLTVIGDELPLPEFVQVNLYRVAQEALTNARRHGGPDATADVRLRYGPEAVELEVANSGRAVVSPRSGLGLLGMHERALASGGELTAMPRTRGGFVVRLRIPLPAQADAAVAS